MREDRDVPTIITEQGHLEVTPVAGGALVARTADLAGSIGWTLEREGLCRGDVCVPTRTRPELRVDGGVDVRVVAELLRRPLVFDDDAGIGVLGESVETRAEQRAGRPLDGFTLTDADGAPFAWSSLGRKKKVLVAWASW